MERHPVSTSSSSEIWEDGLSQAARTLRNLLREVDSASRPLWDGGQLDAALYRYTEIFLPLLAAHLGSGNDNDRIFELQEKANSHLALRYINAKNATVYKKHFQKKEEQDCYLAPFKALGEDVCSALPIPPLDVAFCWALHRLSPIDYEEDCTRLFGMKLETENGLDYVNAANSGDAPSAVARLQWSCFANSVRSLEKKKFGVFQKYCKKVRETFLPQYLWPRYSIANSLVGNELKFRESTNWANSWKPPIRYNIKAASRRQKQFLYNISHSYFDQDASLEKGVIRYKKFLTLMRDHPGTFMVPCYDIDLVWHAHILRDTGGYARNTKEFVGTFVNHKEDEDRSQGGELQTGFQTTNHLWERVYGEVYEDSDTNYKGKLPDRQARVFDETSTLSVKVDHDWAKSFAAESGVCRSCQKDICTHMDHEQCRALLGKAVLLGRGGQVKGGACGALFFKEYVLYASTVVDAGGAFGAAAIEYKRSVEPLRHEFIRSFRDMYAVRQRPISRYGPGDGYYGNGGGTHFYGGRRPGAYISGGGGCGFHGRNSATGGGDGGDGGGGDGEGGDGGGGVDGGGNGDGGGGGGGCGGCGGGGGCG